MPSGTITYWLEIPVKIRWHIEPADPSVGLPEYVFVDIPEHPPAHEIDALVKEHADKIETACREDSREG